MTLADASSAYQATLEHLRSARDQDPFEDSQALEQFEEDLNRAKAELFTAWMNFRSPH